jgi:hypothetical protein
MATLFDLAQAYLNQGMPSISPIFKPITNNPEEEDSSSNLPISDPFSPLKKISDPGGDNFNVYNPDPNITRTQRDYINPFPFNPDSNLGTPDYGYIDPKRKGVLGLLDSAGNLVKNSLIGRGITALGNKLPINQRAILENELIGSGVMLDDIGRVVGDVNTPEGIMAGLNAAKITDETFDKKAGTIRNTLREKYNLSDEEIDEVVAEIDATGTYGGPLGYNPVMGTTTNLFTNLLNTQKAQSLFGLNKKKADIITARKIQERQEKQRAKDIAANEAIVARAEREYREDPGAKSYSGGERTPGDDTSYSDPFDPGGGE